jgi:hypothetical protein
LPLLHPTAATISQARNARGRARRVIL